MDEAKQRELLEKIRPLAERLEAVLAHSPSSAASESADPTVQALPTPAVPPATASNPFSALADRLSAVIAGQQMAASRFPASQPGAPAGTLPTLPAMLPPVLFPALPNVPASIPGAPPLPASLPDMPRPAVPTLNPSLPASALPPAPAAVPAFHFPESVPAALPGTNWPTSIPGQNPWTKLPAPSDVLAGKRWEDVPVSREREAGLGGGTLLRDLVDAVKDLTQEIQKDREDRRREQGANDAPAPAHSTVTPGGTRVTIGGAAPPVDTSSRAVPRYSQSGLHGPWAAAIVKQALKTK